MDNPLIPTVKYATLITEGNGTQTAWDFNFAGGYISPEHVKAFTEDMTTGELVIRPLTLIGPNTAQITPAVADGLRLIIYRDTPKTEPLVDYSTGSILNESSLDKSNKQAVFIAAELADRVIADYDFSNALLYAVTTATDARNVAYGIDAKASAALVDSAAALAKANSSYAVTSQLSGGGGSGLIGFLRNAANAILRTVRDKLHDHVSIKDFGAVGDGVADDSDAAQAATDTGKAVYFPAGVYKISNVERTGKTVWYSKGDVKILSDGPVLAVVNGSGSSVTDFELENITAPWIITRAEGGSQPIIGTIRQSNDPGYQPTVNDGDIWSTLTPEQQAQDIGPVIAFSGNATGINVSQIRGRFVNIIMFDTTNSRVQDCEFRGGKNFAAAILWWNINGQPGYNNRACNNVITYPSFSAITFARNFDGVALGNNIGYCGESGIKTNQGFFGAVDSRCYRMMVHNNSVKFTLYDALDMASDYPNTGTADCRHSICNNDLYGAGQTGIHADGILCILSGNQIRACGADGIHGELSQSLISGNKFWGNNTKLTALGVHHLYIGGGGNTITGNMVTVGGNPGAAIYAPGYNFATGNTSGDGAFFWGNVGSITSILSANVDALATMQTTVASRFRQNTPDVPAVEVYSDVADVQQTDVVFHPRHNQLRHPIARVSGVVTYGADNDEAGYLALGAAQGGVIRDGLYIATNNSVPGRAWPELLVAQAAITPAWLSPGGLVFAVDKATKRLQISVKFDDGTTASGTVQLT